MASQSGARRCKSAGAQGREGSVSGGCALEYEAVWQGERSWNGVAILARNHAPVLTRSSLPGDPEDHQACYIEVCATTTRIGHIWGSGRTRQRVGRSRPVLRSEARFNPSRDSVDCTIVTRSRLNFDKSARPDQLLELSPIRDYGRRLQRVYRRVRAAPAADPVRENTWSPP